MGRLPRVPADLKLRPFTLHDARAAGLTRKHLRGKSWIRLSKSLYCWAGWSGNRSQLIAAWKGLLPSDAVFAGRTAAWLWGMDLDSDGPIEVIVPSSSGVRSRQGLNVRHSRIDPDDVVEVRGHRVTTVLRTICDLCARSSTLDALIAIDVALFKQRADVNSLIAYAAKGLAGARLLRTLAPLAAPAESPMETRLRWILLEAGLPPPESQRVLRDEDGRFIARADLYYPDARLVIEYDGANHRERLTADNRRQNKLLAAGVHLLRFTAADGLGHPDAVVSQVRSFLRTPIPPERSRRARRGAAQPPPQRVAAGA